jgi:post-segregation antitoxin (ccd killing protein)
MKEHVNLTFPEGMRKRAEELGINVSFHAAKAIQKEIDRIEGEESK